MVLEVLWVLGVLTVLVLEVLWVLVLAVLVLGVREVLTAPEVPARLPAAGALRLLAGFRFFDSTALFDFFDIGNHHHRTSESQVSSL